MVICLHALPLSSKHTGSLALAGCTEAEMATITGLSLRSVCAILDIHYLNRDPALADSAIRKLERRTKTPD